MSTRVISYVCALVASVVFVVLAANGAEAASAFKTFTGLGTGDITVAFTGCVDISCPSNTCFCAEGTAIPFSANGGIGAGTIHIEMLMNNAAQTLTVAGLCEPGGGIVFFTGKNAKNTMTFGLSGTFCQTDPSSSGPATVTGGFNILSGGGSFSKAGGSGVFSFGSPILFKTKTGPTQLQLTGNFNKAAPTTAHTGEGDPDVSDAREAH